MGGTITELWRVELLRGLRSLAAGRSDAAEVHFARAYQAAPESPHVCFALGRERLRQGKHQEAERLLRSAWETDRTLAAAAAGLARALGVGLGRLADAHAVLDAAIADHSLEPGLHVVRAELFLEERRCDEARHCLERAEECLRESGRDAPATRSAITACVARAFNLDGIRLGREGRAEEALFAFKRASDLDPAWSGPLLNMGSAFAQLGRAARARACWERVLVHDPDNSAARFHLASLALDRGDVAGARAAVAPLCDRSPDDPAVRYHLARIDEAAGDLGAAEDHLRHALSIQEDHVPSLCRLAALLARSGRFLESSILSRRAHALDASLARELMGEADAPRDAP